MTQLTYKTTTLSLEDVLSGDNIDLSGVDALAAEPLAGSAVPAEPSWEGLADAAGALQ